MTWHLPPDWTCVFSIVSFSLGGCYVLINIAVAILLVRITRQHGASRKAQKLFLFFSWLQSAGRTAFFFIRPMTLYPCGDSTITKTTIWLDLLGTIPAALFISAFSVNVYTFARIFHTVLARQQAHFLCLKAILTLLNVVLYTITIASATIDGLTVLMVWLVSFNAFSIACCFMTYAAGVHREVDQRLAQNARRATRGQYRRRASVSQASYYALLRTVIFDRNSTNPMIKMVFVSTLCLVCFIVRAVILIITTLNNNGQFTWYVSLLYYFVSEIIPISLMLMIFESTGGIAIVKEDDSSLDIVFLPPQPSVEQDTIGGNYSHDFTKSNVGSNVGSNVPSSPFTAAIKGQGRETGEDVSPDSKNYSPHHWSIPANNNARSQKRPESYLSRARAHSTDSEGMQKWSAVGSCFSPHPEGSYQFVTNMSQRSPAKGGEMLGSSVSIIDDGYITQAVSSGRDEDQKNQAPQSLFK